METTLTALWRQDPKQFLEWICDIRSDCFYDVNKICDWLRRTKNTAAPTEQELQSVGYLLAANCLEDLGDLTLFEEERPTSFTPTQSSSATSVISTVVSDVDEMSTNHNQWPVVDPQSAPVSSSGPSPPRRAPSTRRAVSRASSTTSAVTLEHLVIEIEVLHEAILPFAEGELQQMIPEFVLRHTRKRIDMLDARQCTHQLIESININDEFGGWTFDVLFGLLQITLKRQHDAPFPQSWSTCRDSTALSVVVTRGQAKVAPEVRLNHPSLEEWLQQLCEQTKMPHYYAEWLLFLREAHVDRLQHLLDWTTERWAALKISVNAKEIIHRAVTAFRYQDTAKPSNKVSEAESIANVHRVKRFFYYHLGRAGELGYLNADAVVLTFKEVAKAGFEAAELFEGVKALLFSETMPAEEPKKEDEQDVKRIKQRLQTEIVSTEVNIALLEEKETACAAQGQAEIETQLGSDEHLTRIKHELKYLKSELEQHLAQRSTSQLALRRHDRLENQIKETEREFAVYKKAAVVRILHSPTYKDHQLLRRNIKAEIARLKSHLASLQSLLNADARSRSDILKHYRGLIFYGPPGTGKTRMMNEIQKRVGFTSVVLPLAAAEVNRSLVGQTERLILDICNRARLLPHLLCVVSIDEIDALAPKRDEKVSQHKLDSLSVLLSVIEGIKDVPNLIMLAATNRIKMMDEAFLRRMSGQFFVGRPSAAVRRKLLADLNQLGNGRLLDEDVMDFALLLTTNFTGAAVIQLRSNLLVYSYMHQLDKLSKEHLVDQCRVAAKQFSISVGGYTLPDLLVNWRPETNLSLTEGDFTGRMHVDLQQKASQIEIKDADYSTVVPVSSANKKTFLNSVLPDLVKFALDRGIEFVQVFDSSWIVSNAAYDDHKIMEVLSERINECREYKRAMMIFDLDSLVGVNDNQSTSSMGLSTSNSVNNQRLFSYLTDIAKEAKIHGGDEQWVITAALHPYLSKTFKAAVLFSPTHDETTKERQEYERVNLHLNCQNCNLTYVEAENKLNCCSYHDGFLMDTSLPARDWSPLSEDSAMFGADSSKVLWICCGRNLRDGGCKNSTHQPSATGQQDKIGKHARALQLYRDKFDKSKTALVEKQDRAKPRK